MIVDIAIGVLPMCAIYLAVSVAWRARGRVSRRGVLMAYSWPFRFVSAICVGVFGGGGIVVLLLPKNRGGDALKDAMLMLVLIVGPAAWCLWEAVRRRIVITSNELIDIKRRGRRKRIRWRDVAAVSGGAFTGGFYVRSTDGRRIGVSHMLTGQKEFARMVLEKVPADRVQCEALLRRVLDEGP